MLPNRVPARPTRVPARLNRVPARPTRAPATKTVSRPGRSSRDLQTELRRKWGALTPKQRITLLACGSLTVVALLGIAWWAHTPTWSVLYTNLDPKDAQAVVRELQSRQASFDLQNSGTTILVPIGEVDRLRMEMAAKKLPGAGRFGFIQMSGQDDIIESGTQRIRYQKALEDELARTIESLEDVNSARVHLVLPGVLAVDTDVARASVTLSLKLASMPTAEEIRAIVHIVAGAVGGLSPDRVSVVDTSGRTLWEGPGVEGGLVSSRQGEMKHAIEKDVETKVARVLEPLLGAGHFVVRGSADVNFQNVRRVEKTVDPDSAVLASEQKKPRPSAAEPDTATKTYAYSQVERTIEEPAGGLKRLSVAVLIDDAERGGTAAGWELARIEQLVKTAISFTAERGDVVTIDRAPFRQAAEIAPTGVDWGRFTPYLKYPALVALLLLVYVLFYRPMVQVLREPVRERAGDESAPETAEATAGSVGEGDQQQADVATAQPSMLNELPQTVIAAPPHRLAALLEAEPAQTVALVLAYLPKEPAAQILAGMGPERRIDVARRIASLREVRAEVIHRVGAALESRLAAASDEYVIPMDGLRAAADALAGLGHAAEQEVVEALGADDPELGGRLRDILFTFEMLLGLTDRDAQELLKTVDRSTLALALKGAGPELQVLFLRNMSERAGAMLKEEMDLLGTPRPAEIEAARRSIIDQALKLEKEGVITLEEHALALR